MELNSILTSYHHIGKNNKIINEFKLFLMENKTPYSRDNSMGHITGSCWIVDKNLTKALLTHHKKLDIWIPTGGHSEGESNPVDISIREGLEETGLTLKLESTDPFHIDIHDIPKHKDSPKHKHYDITYLFTPVSTLNYTVSSESHDLKWIKLEDILENNYEENIKEMAIKTIKLRETHGR